MGMKTGIVIINYNGENDTIECLNSIKEFYRNENIVIILIDNHSDDPIEENELEAFKINIKYLKQLENTGFAEGCNIGIKEAVNENCEYILLLNNDTVFIDDSLLKMIDLMKEKEEIGICGIVNYYYDKSNEIWQAGAKIDFQRGKIKHISIPNFSKESYIEVDYVPGSSLLIRKNVIEKIGMLDGDYFAYYEEMDFCTRAKRNGYKVAFIPDSHILHKVGVSSTNCKKFYLRIRNHLVFFNKYTGFNFFIIYVKTILNAFKIILKMKNDKIIYLKYLMLALSDFHLNKLGKSHF